MTLEEKAKEIVVAGAAAEMLVLELQSEIDFVMSDKEYRKKMVKDALTGLYEKEKISKTIYEDALNILEN